MGEVLLATREADGTRVAIKVARRGHDGQLVARLRREAELLSRVSSPHLPGYFEIFEVPEGQALVMEFVPGEPLAAVPLQEMDVAERWALCRRTLPGIAAGLSALHAVGIVHRDVKPANVILAARGAVVVDLGLARGPDVVTLTKTGQAMGTPRYLPPEQIMGEGVLPASDLYQVALVFLELLKGWDAPATIDQVFVRAMRPPEDPRQELPSLPEPAAFWIQRSLHPDPGERPDVAKALAALPAVLALDLVPGPNRVQDGPRRTAAAAAESVAERVEEVQLARKRARHTGRWPVPLAGGTEPPKARPMRGGPANPAPWKTGRDAGLWVLAASLGLLAGYAWLPGSGPPPRASSPQVSVVLMVREGELVVLEGAERGASLRRAGQSPKPGPQGYSSLGPMEPGDLTLQLGGETRRIHVPVPLGAGSLELRSPRPGTCEVYLALPGARRLQGVLLVGAKRVPGRWDGGGLAWSWSPDFLVAETQSRPTSDSQDRLLGGFPVEARLFYDRDVQLSMRLPLQDLARRFLGTMELPEALIEEASRAGAGWWQRSPDIWTDTARTSLRRVASVAAALLSSPGLAEDVRFTAYRRLAPARTLEWVWRDAPLESGWIMGDALGGFLELSTFPRLSTGRVPGAVGIRETPHPGPIRLRADRDVESQILGKERPRPLGGEWDAEGRYWVLLSGLPPGPPEHAELGLFLDGRLTPGRLLVHLGSRHVEIPTGQGLRSPLREGAEWIFHGLPAAWIADAKNYAGTVRMGFEYRSFAPGVGPGISVSSISLVEARGP